MVVNDAIKYHCSAPDVLCITVKYIYQNANNYLANTGMLLLQNIAQIGAHSQ